MTAPGRAHHGCTGPDWHCLISDPAHACTRNAKLRPATPSPHSQTCPLPLGPVPPPTHPHWSGGKALLFAWLVYVAVFHAVANLPLDPLHTGGEGPGRV